MFEDGRLSLDQAAVAVTAPAHVDEMMAELAPLSTVAQLRVEVRAATPPADPAEPATPTDSVATWFDRHGRYHLRAELDPTADVSSTTPFAKHATDCSETAITT